MCYRSVGNTYIEDDIERLGIIHVKSPANDVARIRVAEDRCGSNCSTDASRATIDDAEKKNRRKNSVSGCVVRMRVRISPSTASCIAPLPVHTRALDPRLGGS